MNKLFNIIGVFLISVIIIFISNYRYNNFLDLYFLFLLINIFVFMKLPSLLKKISLFSLYLLTIYLVTYRADFTNFEYSLVSFSVFISVSSLSLLLVNDRMNLLYLFFNLLVVFRFIGAQTQTNIFFKVGYFIIIFYYFFITCKNSYNIMLSKKESNIYKKFILLSLSVIIPACFKFVFSSIFFQYILLLSILILIEFISKYNITNYYKIFFYLVMLLAPLSFSYKSSILFFLMLSSFTLIKFYFLKNNKTKYYFKVLINKLIAFDKKIFLVNKEKFFVILIILTIVFIKILNTGKI